MKSGGLAASPFSLFQILVFESIKDYSGMLIVRWLVVPDTPIIEPEALKRITNDILNDLRT